MGKDLRYAKLLTELFDSGLWANMSAGARALYPVLLRFSDGNFKPVWPGTRILLKLTGFKQKSSLRKARLELVDLGLISVSAGTGRKNSYYHFRLDWAYAPRERQSGPPQGGDSATPWGSVKDVSGEAGTDRAYNHVHISINNHVPVPTQRPLANRRQMREQQKILYPNGRAKRSSWAQIEDCLQGQISASSLRMMREALISHENDLYVFSDSLPEHLKALLEDVCPRVFFANDILVSRDIRVSEG